MGNTPDPSVRVSSDLVCPPRQRFSARFAGYEIVDGRGAYKFVVNSPVEVGWVGQQVTRSFEEFQQLDGAMALKYRDRVPALPPSTLFDYTDPAFLNSRGARLEAYLEALLQLEPTPCTQVLRHFLNVWRPPVPSPAAASRHRGAGPLLAAGWRLPIGVAGVILAFREPLWVLQACSPVCRAMWAASRDPRCWPSLRFGSSAAERWLEGLFSLLTPTCNHLLSLNLDIAFENPKLAVALPGGIVLTQLRRLCLRLWGAEAVSFGVELLGCVESPKLQSISVEGFTLTETFLRAICSVALETSGALIGLKLLWAPDSQFALHVHEGEALALETLLASVPALENVTVGVAAESLGCGHTRYMMPLQPPHVAIPGTQPILANMAGLASLRRITFDFLSDDVLFCIRSFADRSLCLSSARFSGVKRYLDDPDDALAVLLSKLGDNLEEFALIVELEPTLRPFLHGILQTRIGALPALWQDRRPLRSLTLNWTAFDDDGIQCIAQNCQGLHTLLLDRSEYWTDRVATEIADNLAELRHFRLRASAMLSDRALYTLGEVAHRFSTLEVEPSYSMSPFALDHLRQKFGVDMVSGLSPGLSDHLGLGLLAISRTAGSAGAGVVSLMAAMAGEPDPYSSLGGSGQERSRGHLRILNVDEGNDTPLFPPTAPVLPTATSAIVVGR